eukprot:GHVT01075888.1.p1 GENE.GHVT01075888.1~~GHVT01075888.1.p1  ORF type:complete len:1769 (-),score=121.54 GHVT01075888.1:1416-6722(-)
MAPQHWCSPGPRVRCPEPLPDVHVSPVITASSENATSTEVMPESCEFLIAPMPSWHHSSVERQTYQPTNHEHSPRGTPVSPMPQVSGVADGCPLSHRIVRSSDGFTSSCGMDSKAPFNVPRTVQVNSPQGASSNNSEETRVCPASYVAARAIPRKHESLSPSPACSVSPCVSSATCMASPARYRSSVISPEASTAGHDGPKAVPPLCLPPNAGEECLRVRRLSLCSRMFRTCQSSGRFLCTVRRKLSHTKEKFVDSFGWAFYRYGEIVFDHPLKFIVISFIIAAILSVGMMFREVETDMYRLYTLPNSAAQGIRSRIDAVFSPVRSVFVIVQANDGLISKPMLERMRLFNDSLGDLTAYAPRGSNETNPNFFSTVKDSDIPESGTFPMTPTRRLKPFEVDASRGPLGQTKAKTAALHANTQTTLNNDTGAGYGPFSDQVPVTLSDICEIDSATGTCSMYSFLDLYPYPDVQLGKVISSRTYPKFVNFKSRRQVQIDSVLGNATLRSRGENFSRGVAVQNATALMWILFLKGDDSITEKSMAWEKKLTNFVSSLDELSVYQRKEWQTAGDPAADPLEIAKAASKALEASQDSAASRPSRRLQPAQSYGRGPQLDVSSQLSRDFTNAAAPWLPLSPRYLQAATSSSSLSSELAEIGVRDALASLPTTAPALRWFVYTERSIEDELGEASTLDTKSYMLFLLGSLALLLYTVLTNGSWPCIRGKIVPAAMGIMSALLGYLAGAGVTYWLGVRHVAPAEGAPFLTVGIGADDMFVILNAYAVACAERDPRKRVAAVMRDSALGISITTLTNLLAFAVGASSPFFSIANFCMITAASLFAGYIMCLTFFLGFLCLSAQQEAYYTDMDSAKRKGIWIPAELRQLFQFAYSSIRKLFGRVCMVPLGEAAKTRKLSDFTTSVTSEKPALEDGTAMSFSDWQSDAQPEATTSGCCGKDKTRGPRTFEEDPFRLEELARATPQDAERAIVDHLARLTVYEVTCLRIEAARNDSRFKASSAHPYLRHRALCLRSWSKHRHSDSQRANASRQPEPSSSTANRQRCHKALVHGSFGQDVDRAPAACEDVQNASNNHCASTVTVSPHCLKSTTSASSVPNAQRRKRHAQHKLVQSNRSAARACRVHRCHPAASPRNINCIWRSKRKTLATRLDRLRSVPRRLVSLRRRRQAASQSDPGSSSEACMTTKEFGLSPGAALKTESHANCAPAGKQPSRFPSCHQSTSFENSLTTLSQGNDGIRWVSNSNNQEEGAQLDSSNKLQTLGSCSWPRSYTGSPNCDNEEEMGNPPKRARYCYSESFPSLEAPSHSLRHPTRHWSSEPQIALDCLPPTNEDTLGTRRASSSSVGPLDRPLPVSNVSQSQASGSTYHRTGVYNEGAVLQVPPRHIRNSLVSAATCTTLGPSTVGSECGDSRRSCRANVSTNRTHELSATETRDEKPQRADSMPPTAAPDKCGVQRNSHTELGLFVRNGLREPAGNGGRLWRLYVVNPYVNFLLRPWVKVMIIIGFIGLLAGAAYSCKYLEFGLSYYNVIPDNSKLRDFYDARDVSFSKYGDRYQVLFDSPTIWWSSKVQERFLEMSDVIDKASYTSYVTNGMAAFLHSRQAKALIDGDHDQFIRTLKKWMSEDDFGKHYRKDFHLSTDTDAESSLSPTSSESLSTGSTSILESSNVPRLTAWKFEYFQKYVLSTTEARPLLDACRQDVIDHDLGIYGECFFFAAPIVDVDEQILLLTIRNMGIALVCIIVVRDKRIGNAIASYLQNNKIKS